MLSNLAEFVDVSVGEALLDAAEEVRASPVAVDAQQTFPHVSLGGGNLSWKKKINIECTCTSHNTWTRFAVALQCLTSVVDVVILKMI